MRVKLTSPVWKTRAQSLYHARSFKWRPRQESNLPARLWRPGCSRSARPYILGGATGVEPATAGSQPAREPFAFAPHTNACSAIHRKARCRRTGYSRAEWLPFQAILDLGPATRLERALVNYRSTGLPLDHRRNTTLFGCQRAGGRGAIRTPNFCRTKAAFSLLNFTSVTLEHALGLEPRTSRVRAARSA